MYKAIIKIDPKPKPRMTARSKWTVKNRAYLAYQEALAWEFDIVPKQPHDLVGDLVLTCSIFSTTNYGDLKNYIAGVEDSLQYSNVIKNDRQIVEYNKCRLYRRQKEGRIEVILRPLVGE